MVNIERINELAKKSRTSEGLTEEEKKEQIKLRNEYRESFRKSLINELEHTYIMDVSGNKTKVKKKED